MKKLCSVLIFSILFLFVTSVQAGPAKVLVFQEVAGVTVMAGASAASGTSRVCVIDLKEAIGPDQIFATYSLTYPHGGRGPDGESGVSVITFGVNTAASRYATPSVLSTGTAATAGVTVPYFYVVTNTPKTAREIESLGTSGVTSISATALDSGDTPFQVFVFTPESGRYLHILVGSSTTDYNRPGVYVGIN